MNQRNIFIVHKYMIIDRKLSTFYYINCNWLLGSRTFPHWVWKEIGESKT